MNVNREISDELLREFTRTKGSSSMCLFALHSISNVLIERRMQIECDEHECVE
jgi:hypothetical protein